MTAIILKYRLKVSSDVRKALRAEGSYKRKFVSERATYSLYMVVLPKSVPKKKVFFLCLEGRSPRRRTRKKETEVIGNFSMSV